MNLLTTEAQTYPSVNISTKDGLPNNQVESIFKDSRGILWVGTNNGLSKIENNQITNFYVEDGLAHNSSWDIIEDNNNNIWIASYGGGVTKYDGKTFKIFNKKNGVVHNFVRRLFEYKDYVFIGTEEGLSFINKNNDQISTFNSSNPLEKHTDLPNFQVMGFFVYNNQLYCGTFKRGIFKLNVDQKTVEKVFDHIKQYSIFSLYLDKEICYYSMDGLSNKSIGGLRKLKTNNILKNNQEDIIFGKSIIWGFAKDNKDNLYTAGWGIYRDDGGVFQIKKDSLIDKTDGFDIGSRNIKCVFFDKTNNFLFAGSQDKGYYKVDLNETITFYEDNKLEVLDIEKSNLNMAILAKNDFILLENQKVIKKVNSKRFLDIAINYFRENPSLPPNIISENPSFRTLEEFVFYDLVQNKSSYWISSYIGLFEFDLRGNFLNYYPILTFKFDLDFQERFLYPIPYASFRLVTTLKNTKGYYSNIIESKEFHGKEPNTPVNVSDFVKAKGEIYISTFNKGLFVFKNNTFLSLNNTNDFKELEPIHLAVNNVSNILAIASNSGEVFLADINNGFKIVKKLSKESLYGNSILFLEIYKGYVLIGTENGLIIYNNGAFRFIDEEQGLKNHHFTSSKIIGNHLIIGTNSGYYSIHLDRLLSAKSNYLKATLTNIQVNRLKDTSSINNWFELSQSNFTFKYNENVVDIDFKVANHPYPNKLYYSYQVSGLDSTWSKFTNSPKIFLQYLPVGEYSINVKTKDLNSGSVSVSKLAGITILPPFWKTIWFIIVITLIVLISGFVFYIKRIQYIKERERKKAKIQQRLVETKLEALQSQMNPHFTFNAMNSIQNYIIDNDIDNALMYLSEFAKLIRTTLDNSSKPLILLEEEISYLKSYIALENMRFNNKVDISINHDEMDIHEIELPPMVIQPFVENAFVHAFEKNHPNPKLEITFSITNQTLICQIEDNGIGMSHSKTNKLHQSKGLKLVSERLNLLNNFSKNSFQTKSEERKGTTVTIEFELS